jgi:hypothetical protein
MTQYADNDHLRFWLVRNHAGDLQVPRSWDNAQNENEQVQNRQGKRRKPGYSYMYGYES